jgi:hypothetical protein
LGLFVGVALRLSDGSLYGTLCCLSHEPNDALGDRDVGFLSMIAELIVHDLDEQVARRHLRAALLELVSAESVDVAYPPIFDVRSNVCLGVEALARFPSRSRSPIARSPRPTSWVWASRLRTWWPARRGRRCPSQSQGPPVLRGRRFTMTACRGSTVAGNGAFECAGARDAARHVACAGRARLNCEERWPSSWVRVGLPARLTPPARCRRSERPPGAASVHADGRQWRQ